MPAFLSSIEAWQVWTVVGIVLCILEIFTTGFFLMALGIGCFAAAGISLIFGINGQITAGIIVAVGFFFMARTLIHRKEPAEKFGMDKLVGESGIVIEAVTKASGQVKIGGEQWPARVEGNVDDIPEGTAVVVTRYEGNKLMIRRKEQ